MVAPLDWGLGHATRCIPMIDALLVRGVEVVLASSGKALALLQNHYPALEAVELPTYTLRFSAGKSQVAMMSWQIPGIVRMIRREHRWLKQYVKRNHLDAIISDHRLGMWHPEVESVLLVHQVAIQPPTDMQAVGPLLFRLHWRYVNRFDHIWIPDIPGEQNLSGELVPEQIRELDKVKYIGALSHLAGQADSTTKVWPDRIPLLIILSGLEPHRTLLEDIIRKEVEKSKLDAILVQGLSGKLRREKKGSLLIINFLASQDLAYLCSKADVVISRTGYSSLMDYAALGKKNLILIPTPGQTEQAYLAQRIMQQNIAVVQQQHEIDLIQAFEQLPYYAGFNGNHFSDTLLKEELDALLYGIIPYNS